MKSPNSRFGAHQSAATDELMPSAMLVIYPVTEFSEDEESTGTKKVFLNEWCAKEFLLTNESSLNFEIAKPPYLSQQERDRAVETIAFYEEELFPAIVTLLNKYHHTNFSELFWKKLIGNWFKRFVQMTFYNLVSLESCFSHYKIVEIHALPRLLPTLPFKFTADINTLKSDPDWVSNFNLKLLTFITRPRFDIRYASFKVQENLPLESNSRARNQKRVVINYLYRFVRVFSSSTRYFFFSTYLPRKSEILLNLRLRQIPQRWEAPDICLDGLEDLELRRELTSQLRKSDSTGMEAALAELIFEYFPICYLEGWKKLKFSVETLNWPKFPKAIFTSNEFDTNEHFKVWAALNCLKGSKYIVGQHGNNYGTNRYMKSTIEELTSDKFITWGWSRGLSNHFKGINLRTAGKRFHQNPNSSSALLVGAPFENEVDIWCGNFSQRVYIDDQATFLYRLSPKIRGELIVRPYQSTGLTQQNEFQIWDSHLENIAFDSHKVFYDSVKNSKLVIFSYDSTGLLELLSLNVPVVAFWQIEFTHISEEALPFYEGLLKVGILHHSPESIADHVNEIWPDILKWWNSPFVQGARSTFCKEYSATTKLPIKFLSNMIKSWSMET